MLRRLATAVVVLAIAIVAGVAIFDAVRSGGAQADERAVEPRPDRLRGPDVPQPAVLPGRLIVATQPGCRLVVLDLRTLESGPEGPSTACRIWAASTGVHAVVARRDPQTGTARDLWLVRVDADQIAIERRLGLARSRPTWSPDGTVVAWCGEDGQTVVRDLAVGRSTRLDGCYPTIQADGSIVTRTKDRIVLVDGKVLTGPEPTLRTRLVGQGAGPDGPALAIQGSFEGFAADTSLELWNGGEPERTLTLPTLYGPVAGYFGLRIELSPNGREAAFISPEALEVGRADDLAALVDLTSGRLSERIAAPTFAGLAWSPDGAWLALATGQDVLLFGSSRVDPVYVLPISAGAVAWLRG